MSNSLRPHGRQHTGLPYPSPTHGAYGNSCPSSQWCHPNISSPLFPFPCHLQSFPAPGYFPKTVLCTTWLKHWSFSFQWVFRRDHLIFLYCFRLVCLWSFWMSLPSESIDWVGQVALPNVSVPPWGRGSSCLTVWSWETCCFSQPLDAKGNIRSSRVWNLLAFILELVLLGFLLLRLFHLA